MVSSVTAASSVARLAALLQQLSVPQAASKRQTAQASGSRPAATLASTLHQRLLALDSTPRRDHRAAARLLIETLLINEFGTALAADEGFQSLIDEVLDTMEASPALAADVRRLMDGLMGPRGP